MHLTVTRTPHPQQNRGTHRAAATPDLSLNETKKIDSLEDYLTLRVGWRSDDVGILCN